MQMVTGGTRISSQYYQLTVGGDIAALAALCKAVIEADDEAKALGRPRVCDTAFIEQHTHGFEDFAAFCRDLSWGEIEELCGVTAPELRRAANTYMQANAVMIHYGMGITQHKYGVDTVKMIVNLLLLRGNI